MVVNALPVNTPELYILGMGHFHPENLIDNGFLESLDIGTNDEWITERTGIKTRRTVLNLDYIRETKNQDPMKSHEASLWTNGQTGAFAAQMAMTRAGITKDQIGLVIAGGCSPQHTIPAEACMVAAELGIEATCFDLGSACSSFAAQMNFLNNSKPETLPEYILIINAENTTRTVDYSDRSNAVLWGDGTAAAVVSTRRKGKLGVLGATLQSDPSGWNKVAIPTGGHFFQNGSAVQTFAIRKSGETLTKLQEFLTREDYWYVGHQANLLMLQSVCNRAGITEQRHLYNVHTFGNCGAAGAPSVISQNWEKFKPGEEIALVVVGSGLTWGGLALKVY